jgi:hypothetical protein
VSRARPVLRESVECGDDCEACRVDVEERSAIVEDGGETRAEADRLAREWLRDRVRG